MWHYLDAMRKNSRDEWLQELNARQRNIVFPDTVNNETEMWRRLGEKPMSPIQKIGLGLMAIFVFGLALVVFALGAEGYSLHNRILAAFRFWGPVAIIGILIFGPLMAILASATKRALRNSRR
jgi:hypothetical protein